ncbi:hypothetical protein [Caballeronia sp. GAWG2-1]|uniref:hypothetical protein n=1 Tax=Caballeronia sp. GAWG2-1 TaxID=2921744 RepID=UPI0020287B92|nr:hypothetical protein [Caballeronia sp. GAWG2-1]
MNQPATVSAAMSEIVRVSWWSLRALGCPVGAIEAMARVLAYSQALDGHTLAAVREHERALVAAFSGHQPSFDASTGVINAAGRSMLDMGPRVVDLIAGMAKRKGGAVRVGVTHLADLIGLTGAATIAAKRGLGLVIIDGKHTWRVYAATRDGDVTSLSGQLGDASVSDALIASWREIAGEKFLPTLPAANADQNSLDVIAFPFVADDGIGARADNAKESGITCQHIGYALKRAYSHGVDVQKADLGFLYQLETRTWAPSSERSRMQAGFQAPSPAA